MATFNIYGYCICRDLFGFTPDNKHTIIHFLQSSSQIVNFIYPTKPHKVMTENDFINVSGMASFKKKCIINDYNKTVLDYYVEPSDYFIIDLLNIANTNLVKEVTEDGYEHYFTYSLWFKKAYESGLNTFFSESNLEIINRLKLIKQIGTDEILDKMIQWLTGTLGYRNEQIILIENKRAALYTNGEEICFFSPGTRDTVNTLMDGIYSAFVEKCPGCHVIKAPYGSIAATANPWGLSDLHFTQSYYDYLYSCVEAIVYNKNSKQEIEKLHEKYSEENEKTINFLTQETIERLEEERMSNQELLQGSFLPDMPFCYIAKKGAKAYQIPNVYSGCEYLSDYTEISNYNVPFAKTVTGRYVNFDDCVWGVCGHGKAIGEFWETINRTTCVMVKSSSLIITHSGIDSDAQMNIVQILDSAKTLYGKTVVLSIYARVLEFSDDQGRGGTVAIINHNSYNRGIFFASKEFRNKEWQKIVLTATLPKQDDFLGLTICLRANAGKEKHAAVEYCMPSLQIRKEIEVV